MLAATGSSSTPIFTWIILAMIFVGAGAALLWNRKYRRAATPFACPKCGFDLRGSVKPGPVTCPECGSVYT